MAGEVPRRRRLRISKGMGIGCRSDIAGQYPIGLAADLGVGGGPSAQKLSASHFGIPQAKITRTTLRLFASQYENVSVEG